MRSPVASLASKLVAVVTAFVLASSLAPLAWADDGPTGTVAGTVAGSAAEGSENPEGVTGTEGPDAQAPEAEAKSASTKAAEGSGAGGTTVSIAVYRSSFPIAKWDLNDDDYSLTKATWDNRPADSALPQQGSPGSEVAWPETGKPAGYEEPTRAGFEFAGWSTNKSASAGGYIDGTSPKLTMPEGAPEAKEYTLYALWTPNEYSVIFDLSKNPESKKGPGDDASFDLKWASSDGVRTVTDLGGGRFRVDGFTMKEADYDKATRTVGLPEPARSGYRFLGWSEPDGQSLAMDNASKTGFAMNPVRLTQIDGTPVLTARWTTGFGVTAPLSITFGDYDKTGAPGNPWLGDKDQTAADDTTQSEADDITKPEQEGYQALGQAYFENTGWHEAVKLVGLTSARHANANQVLTTYDSSKASEAQVLGDGTEENPGERLLSLYPSDKASTADKSSGVHFRLTDAVDEATLKDAFTMAPQGEEGAKKEISYGLNLSTDPVDGSANHGLVLPTNDYERKQIATVSYTFATAKAASEDPELGSLYIVDGTRTYGLSYINMAAKDIAAHDNGDGTSSSRFYAQFKGYLDSGMDPGTDDAQGFVKWGDGATYNVRIIGINHDDKSDGSGKAGLTFQLARALDSAWKMNQSATASGGWGSSWLRGQMNNSSGGVYRQVPSDLRAVMAAVRKLSNNGGGTAYSKCVETNDTLFLPSVIEYFGDISQVGVANASRLQAEGSQYAYWAAQPLDKRGGAPNPVIAELIIHPSGIWLRSPSTTQTTTFYNFGGAGNLGSPQTYGAADSLGVVACFAL